MLIPTVTVTIKLVNAQFPATVVATLTHDEQFGGYFIPRTVSTTVTRPNADCNLDEIGGITFGVPA